MTSRRLRTGLLIAATLLGVAFTLACCLVAIESHARAGTVTKPVMYGLDFIGPRTGWVVGERAKVLRTTTGGATWTKTTAPDAQGAAGDDAFFSSRLTGWIVGSYGVAWQTRNGGATWRRRDVFPGGAYVRMKLLGSSLGWAVDGDVDDRSEHAAEESYTVWKTTDGGRLWPAVASGTGSALTDIDFVDASTGWAVGALAVVGHDEFGNVTAYNVAMVRATTDGGVTWSVPLGPADLGMPVAISHLWAVDFKDALHGWAVGDVRDERGVIVRTADGGLTWSATVFRRFRRFTRISMATARVGWVTGVGGGNRVLKTVDGGRSWTVQYLPRGTQANDVDAVSKTTAFVAGERFLDPQRGVIARTVDGGRHWVRVW